MDEIYFFVIFAIVTLVLFSFIISDVIKVNERREEIEKKKVQLIILQNFIEENSNGSVFNCSYRVNYPYSYKNYKIELNCSKNVYLPVIYCSIPVKVCIYE